MVMAAAKGSASSGVCASSFSAPGAPPRSVVVCDLGQLAATRHKNVYLCVTRSFCARLSPKTKESCVRRGALQLQGLEMCGLLQKAAVSPEALHTRGINRTSAVM